jgi:hypothetical protein
MLPGMHKFLISVSQNKEENTSHEKLSHSYFKKRIIETTFFMKLTLRVINCMTSAVDRSEWSASALGKEPSLPIT